MTMSLFPAAAQFFPGGHAVLREKLEAYLQEMSARLGAQLWAKTVAGLLLAGGYGRGEGGVFQKDGEPALYNDLEFYLVLKHPRAGAEEARKWCAEEVHLGEAATGIEVEFKILSLGSLRRAEPSMFFYDLLSANVFVFGDETLAERLPARLRDAAQIPAHEAARLLFNRGTGLLFCRRALAENSERVRDGFIERNHAKARLAFGDAVLALNGRYHFSALVRSGRVDEPMALTPPNWKLLRQWHRAAVEFKFHPRHEQPPPETLAARQNEIVRAWSEIFLWVESMRLGEVFSSAQNYAAHPGRLFPEKYAALNFLLQVRDCLRRGAKPLGWRDYPRAALQRTLVLLLESQRENDARTLAAKLLALPADAAPERICEAYEFWWRHYN